MKNPYAKALMADGLGEIPRHRGGRTGNLVLVSTDGADVDLEAAEYVCRHCHDVLEPLFEQSASGRISRESALAEATPEKLAAWREAQASRGAGTRLGRPDEIGSQNRSTGIIHSLARDVAAARRANYMRGYLSTGAILCSNIE